MRDSDSDSVFLSYYVMCKDRRGILVLRLGVIIIFYI